MLERMQYLRKMLVALISSLNLQDKRVSSSADLGLLQDIVDTGRLTADDTDAVLRYQIYPLVWCGNHVAQAYRREGDYRCFPYGQLVEGLCRRTGSLLSVNCWPTSRVETLLRLSL